LRKKKLVIQTTWRKNKNGNYTNHSVLIGRFTTSEVPGVGFGQFEWINISISQPNATAYNGLPM